MKEFSITYLTPDGDTSTVWLNAEDLEDAKQKATEEYWDISEIIIVKPIND